MSDNPTSGADAGSSFKLVAPEAVKAVTPAQAAESVPLEAKVTSKLDSQVKDFIDGVLNDDVHSDNFRKRVGAINALGNADIQASASVSNRMMERPVKAMEQSGVGETSNISHSLVDLRNTIEKLDPGKQGDLFSPRKLLGLIPFGNKITAYFDRYRSSQTHLNAIIQSLYSGQDELQKDNAAIEQEKQNLWQLMQRLQQWVYFGRRLDSMLDMQTNVLSQTDPEKAKVIRDEVLFPVRQKITDLLTQLAVDSQGYLALDLIRRNNLELIKGVDRATTTTVSALRTAVMVAQALANEKLVLDQITALNTTTGNIIESTGRLLQQQTASINEQASSATIDIAKLQSAFNSVYQTMDAIANYKEKALANMSQTVETLGAEVEKSQKYLDRVRGQQTAGALKAASDAVGGDGVVRLNMNKRACILSAALALLAACGGGDRGKRASDPAHTLTVLAGSELKDIEPLLDTIRKHTGVTLDFTYSGTLAGIDRIEAGDQFDAVWFSNDKYLVLSDAKTHRIKAQEKIMLSPVVMGVKASKAKEFGWVGNAKITWADIAAKVKAGKLKYAMTNPTASNSGFSAVMGVAAALSHTSNAITKADIDSSALHSFFQGQALTAGSSGWLAESFLRDQDRLDAMINYESVLLTLNREGKLREKLVLIYPLEGIVTADYPLVLLNTAKRPLYDTLVAYLRGADFQRQLMTATLRRPVNPAVHPDANFPSALIVELPFPADIGVVDQILDAYLNEQRVPAHSIFLLDVSGSMRGDRLEQLVSALDVLAGADTTHTGRFARFQQRERVTLLPFSSDVEQVRSFEILPLHMADTLAAIQTFAHGLTAEGGTAIYSALEAAYSAAAQAQKTDPHRYYSIVLMTDGESNEGVSESAFERFYAGLPPEARAVKVFPIIFGEGSRSALKRVAELTGGRLFDGSTASLSAVFKEIRGYQ